MDEPRPTTRWTLCKIFRWRPQPMDKSPGGECSAMNEMAEIYRNRRKAEADKDQ